MTRPVSVVINTYNRAEPLGRLLCSLTQLDYPRFEVIVVNGPSTDATEETLFEFRGCVRVVRCDERNLSRSRNAGIAHAAGEIVAFIDDDAYPDPAWLDRLVEGFDRADVAAVGGPVYDHTGAALQARYSVATRFGEAWVEDYVNSTNYLGRPLGRTFAYTIGTNSAFLRERLIEIGGFDEQFDYYLDETDVCCRLLDQGYLVKLVDDAFVYHKFLASDVRNTRRGIRNRYSIIRNIVYFALRHALPVTSFYEVCKSIAVTIEKNRLDYRWSVDNGYLTEADYEQYLRDVPLASEAGLEAWRSGPLTRAPAWFGVPQGQFLPFTTIREEADKLHVCLFSQEYPPADPSSLSRIGHALATGLAGAGHVVHVLTRSTGHPMVDLEDGVWVHRVAIESHPLPPDQDVPQAVWDYSASLLKELRTIDERRPVDIVHVPNRDCEGIAVLHSQDFKTVVGLYAPLVVGSAVEVERFTYAHAGGLLAFGHAVVDEIRSRCGLALDGERVWIAALGLPDRAGGETPPRHDGGVELLVAGRLDRSGAADTLLACLPRVMEELPQLSVTIIGGRTDREQFESSAAGKAWSGRVQFTGPAGVDEFARRCAACEVVVAPSCDEWFGWILIEAMMQGKAVIGCDVAATREIVEDGGNGLLVAPGDAEALGRAISELAVSPQLQIRLGRRGRELYEEAHTVTRMIQSVTRYYWSLLATGRGTDAGGAEERRVIAAPRPHVNDGASAGERAAGRAG